MISTTLFSTLQKSKFEPCDNSGIMQVRFLVQIATDEKKSGCQPPIILLKSVHVSQGNLNPSMIQDRFKDPLHFANHITQLRHLWQPSHAENSNRAFLFQAYLSFEEHASSTASFIAGFSLTKKNLSQTSQFLHKEMEGNTFTPELAITCKDKCAISHISPDQLVQVKTLQAYYRQ